MKAVGELRSLTGLRGLAAVFVVVYHLFFGVSVFRPVDLFFMHGYLAVDLFFILSGFVMTMCYGEDFSGGVPKDVFPTFIYKRIGRIYPLYVFVLSVYVALSAQGVIQNRSSDTSTVITNGLMLQSVMHIKSISPPSWSISTEFIAYLIFPMLVWILRPFRPLKECAVAMACFAILATIATLPNVLRTAGPLDIYNTTQIYPLLRCLAGFTLGMVVFDLSKHPLALRFAGNYTTLAITLALLVSMCLPGTDLLILILFCVLVLALSGSSSVIERALSSRPIHWLGLISYSIYLDHQILSDAFREKLTALFRATGVSHASSLASLAFLPFIIIVSNCTFYAIERPARSMFRRRAHLRVTPISVEPSAP